MTPFASSEITTCTGTAKGTDTGTGTDSGAVRVATAVALRLVDPGELDLDDDTWIEWCAECGTLDNAGDLLCPDCIDVAA